MSIRLAFLFSCFFIVACQPQQASIPVKATPAETPNKTIAIALHSANQHDINDIAKTLKVSYHLLTNIPDQHCDKNKANGACFTVKLNLTATQAITAKNWQITFSQISPVQSYQSDEFKLQHINGDIHQITLTNKFTGFKAGETKSIIFRANFWMLSETDALPNYIVSSTTNNADIKAKVIVSTQPTIDKETGLELLPFVVPFTDEEKQFKRTKNDKTSWLTPEQLYQRNLQQLGNKKLAVTTQIIPTPQKVMIDPQKRTLDISQGIHLTYNNVAKKEVSAALKHLATLDVQQTINGVPVILTIHKKWQQPLGSYHLNIMKNKITIDGGDASGVFYGLSSISSLLTLGVAKLPLLSLEDQPHYQFRGMLVDVARNFHSKAFILKLLDQMAVYKLNKLHLHLADDEGWRLEIPGLPELTQVSSKRCFIGNLNEDHCLAPQLGAGVNENSSVNGYYTVSDYQEILKAASERHIQVIPSLDMPGHSRAAIKAMQARYKKLIIAEQYQQAVEYLLSDKEDKTKYSSVQYYHDNTLNVCMESTYHFIEKVMQEVQKIHLDAGQPLTRYHIGADETAGAWLDSPQCKNFLANNKAGITKADQLGAYFIERVANMLAKMGVETAGWSDGLSHTDPKNMPLIVQANAWDVLFWQGHKKVHQLANQQWQIVISSPDALYFDFPYEADPKEHGYYWASRHTNTEKIFHFMPDNLPANAEFYLDREDNPYQADDTIHYDKHGKIISAPLHKNSKFLGIQGQLWSENTRSDTMAEYKIYPRLLALAERAWHKANWAVPYNYNGGIYNQNTNTFDLSRQQQYQQQWRLFANTLGQKELAKLSRFNIHYRLPTVGAIIEDGMLKANNAFPGLAIEYQENNKPWQLYTQPIAVNDSIKIRTVTANKHRKGRLTQLKELIKDKK